MSNLLWLALVIVAIAVLSALGRRAPGARDAAYQMHGNLLSPAERSFYGVLVQAVGNAGLVFCKIRVADVLKPRKGGTRSEWRGAFNSISSKHFDFVICDPATCAVKLAVELDDASHGAAQAQARDRLVNRACESAGLPLVRIRAARGYAIDDLRREVMQHLQVPHAAAVTDPKPPLESVSPPVWNDAPSANVPPIVRDVPEPTPPIAEASQSAEAESARRICHKCGQPMVLRKAEAGAHAGQRFWGCSAFPRCRAVAKH